MELGVVGINQLHRNDQRTRRTNGALLHKSNILNIRDIRQLSIRLDNLRLKERQNTGPEDQPTK